MSRDSRNYDSSSNRESSYQLLPPIRDVFGDVLEQPARHSLTPGNAHYYSSSRRAMGPHASDQSSYNDHRLPPLRSHSAENPPSRYSPASQGSSSSQRSYSQYPRAEELRRERSEPAKHSYDVFAVSASQGLVHQRTSNRDDFRQSAKEEAISSSTGKHACLECGRRFEKLSHFKNHMNSHSGEKPYQCPWPGCGKTFSASSNMRRHERSHGNGDDIRKDNTHDSEAMQDKWDSKRYPNSRSYYH